MKNKILMLITLLATLAFGGCGTAETNTAANSGTSNPPANNTTAANSAKPPATPTAPPALPASDLKPDAISLDKPVPAEELRNAVFGDEAAWKGKEVAVIGEYNGHSESKLQSGDKYSINVQVGPQNVVIKCDGRTAPPEDIKDKRKDRVFKGTVKDVNKSWQQVTLEPCEVVK